VKPGAGADGARSRAFKSGDAMTILETERPTAEEAEQRPVWDWPLRLFHWALVAAVVGAFVTDKMGVRYFAYHVWCGYAVITLVGFRLVWGFVGPRHARFANFLRGPSGVLAYLSALGRGRQTHHPGHNPLGALMAVTLIGALGAQAGLGLFANDEIFDFGPLYGYVSKATSLRLTSLHETLFWLIAAAVALHVAAVLAHVARGEPLIRAMITGRKPARSVAPEEAIGSSRGWLAAALFAFVAAALAAIVLTAPALDSDVF
jgi:cytochrome b